MGLSCAFAICVHISLANLCFFAKLLKWLSLQKNRSFGVIHKSIKPDDNSTSIPSIRQSGKILFQVLQYITTKSCLGAKDDEGDDEDVEGNQENGEKSKRPEMESETPWVSLASLALFKLFNDWQAQVPITTIFKVLLKRFKTKPYPRVTSYRLGYSEEVPPQPMQTSLPRRQRHHRQQRR